MNLLFYLISVNVITRLKAEQNATNNKLKNYLTSIIECKNRISHRIKSAYIKLSKNLTTCRECLYKLSASSVEDKGNSF